MRDPQVYPFSAIVGQERLRHALILNAVNPAVGGVLIRGEKGTAKSTAVRGLAALLPEIRVVKGCPYRCDPDRVEFLCEVCRSRAHALEVEVRRIEVVTLPLNATEERVAGGFDFDRAVREGRRNFQPGLLARAHRGMLYVDEVNLLDDHIVDIVLDAAASGRNVVEREGVSFAHPARFVLVGTMNPEEGALRPQLLDRFGLCVDVEAVTDPEERVELMERREAYDASPSDFIERFRAENAAVAERIRRARRMLAAVRMPERLRSLVSELAVEQRVAGHRADLIMEQAARAAAALRGHWEVSTEDIREVAPLVLAHRKREPSPPPREPDRPQSPPHSHGDRDQERGEHGEREQAAPQNQTGARNKEKEGEPGEGRSEAGNGIRRKERKDSTERIFEVGDTFRVKRFASPRDRIVRRGSGRRSRTRTAQKQGRYVRSTPVCSTGDVALDATLRAAAPYQVRRKPHNGLALVLRPEDIREKIREKRVGNFLLFLVDASGSMGARGRMSASKGAILSLLLDAYQKRDRIAMISFRRQEAVVNLPPTASIETAARLLKEMPVGGRTPLSAGLVRSYTVLRAHLLREPTARPILIVITDGRSNVALGEKNPMEEVFELAALLAADERIRSIVVDTESPGMVTFGLARKLAAALNAHYFQIEDLKADALVRIAKENIG